MAYYDYCTGENWCKPETYDFCVNSAVRRIEGTADLLYQMLSRKEWER